MHPSCILCAHPLDPVTRPPGRIICGHVYCTFCLDHLVTDRSLCPSKCHTAVPLRPRDIRSLHVSVVDTTEVEDEEAVADVIKAAAEERSACASAVTVNTTDARILSALISSQLGSLARFSALTLAAVSKKQQVEGHLQDAGLYLEGILEREQLLMAELVALQSKVRALKSTANCAFVFPRSKRNRDDGTTLARPAKKQRDALGAH